MYLACLCGKRSVSGYCCLWSVACAAYKSESGCVGTGPESVSERRCNSGVYAPVGSKVPELSKTGC